MAGMQNHSETIHPPFGRSVETDKHLCTGYGFTEKEALKNLIWHVTYDCGSKPDCLKDLEEEYRQMILVNTGYWKCLYRIRGGPLIYEERYAWRNGEHQIPLLPVGAKGRLFYVEQEHGDA